MNCLKCGKMLKKNDVFCSRCGERITENQNKEIDNLELKQKDGLKDLSLIISILSIILVFIFQIFTIPLSIIGIVSSIKVQKYDSKGKCSFILSVISLILAIPIYLFYTNILFSTEYSIIGTWNCSREDILQTDYDFSVEFNEDNSFIWNVDTNNYIIGTYELEDFNYNFTHVETNLSLHGEKFVDGILVDDEYNYIYAIGLASEIADNGDVQAILVDGETFEIYYCFLQE